MLEISHRIGQIFAAFVIATLFAPSAVFAISYRDDVGPQPYLDFAADPIFDSVGSVGEWQLKEKGVNYWNIRYESSGVLIAPGWVLTAAHVTQKALGGGDSLKAAHYFDSDSVLIKKGFKLNEISGFSYAREVIPFPQFSRILGNGYDIALMRVGVDYVPATGPAERNRSADLIGEQMTAAGYGYRVAGIHNPNVIYQGVDDFLVKSAAQNTIDAFGSEDPDQVDPANPGNATYNAELNAWVFSSAFGDSYVSASPSDRELLYDFDRPGYPELSTLGNSAPLPLEGLMIGGDSGGGIFIERDGRTLLAGIQSAFGSDGSRYDGAYSAVGKATRVDVYNDWIDDHINFASYELSSDGVFSDGALWNGTRGAMKPDANHSAIFNLPSPMSSSEYWGEYQHLGDVPTRATFTVALTQDEESYRLRVRRASDLTLDLGGHTYGITSQSMYTAAVTLGETYGDAPILRLRNGRFEAWDVAIASNPGEKAVFQGQGELALESGATAIISDSIYLGIWKPTPLDDESQGYLARGYGESGRAIGRAVLRVEEGSSLTVGGEIALADRGRSSWYTNSDGFYTTHYRDLGGHVYLDGGELTTHVLNVGAGYFRQTTGTLTFDELILREGGTFIAPTLTFTDATVRGTGQIDAPMTNGGTVSPGFSTGQLTINGSYVQTAAGTLLLEILGLDDFDQLIVTGEASFDGTLDLQLLTLEQGFHLDLGDTFALIDYDTWDGSLFAGIADGSVLDVGNYGFLIDYDADLGGGDLALTATVVTIPEPTSAAMLLIVAGGVSLSRSRPSRIRWGTDETG